MTVRYAISGLTKEVESYEADFENRTLKVQKCSSYLWFLVPDVNRQLFIQLLMSFVNIRQMPMKDLTILIIGQLYM